MAYIVAQMVIEPHQFSPGNITPNRGATKKALSAWAGEGLKTYTWPLKPKNYSGVPLR
jgi:hypothetical protein